MSSTQGTEESFSPPERNSANNHDNRETNPEPDTDTLFPSSHPQRRQDSSKDTPKPEREKDSSEDTTINATKESSFTEKENGKDDDGDDEGEGTAFAPIKSSDENRLQASRSIERSWSLNDGYSVHTGDEQSGEKVDEEAGVTGGGELPEFVVGWDENDPMNPRNMNTGRRWLIVVICSLGSLCV